MSNLLRAGAILKIHERWNAASIGDHSPQWLHAYAVAMFDLGLITDMELEAWARRFYECPTKYPHHEGVLNPAHCCGQSYCAYCPDFRRGDEE